MIQFKKIRNFKEGIETALGASVLAAVIFDRDYRCDDECNSEIASLQDVVEFAHIHKKKEVENFFLVAGPLKEAIKRRLAQRTQRTDDDIQFCEDVEALLGRFTDPMRKKIEALYLSKRRPYECSKNPGYDESTINEQLLGAFECQWQDAQNRLLMVPGKQVISALNTYLQEHYSIAISFPLILECFKKSEIPVEMVVIVDQLERFRRLPPD